MIAFNINIHNFMNFYTQMIMNVLADYMIRSLLYEIIDSVLDDSEQENNSQHYLHPNKNLSTSDADSKDLSGYLFIEGAEPRTRDSYYLALREDYSSRPNVTDMDWANCSWADPHDSLFPSE